MHDKAMPLACANDTAPDNDNCITSRRKALRDLQPLVLLAQKVGAVLE